MEKHIETDFSHIPFFPPAWDLSLYRKEVGHLSTSSCVEMIMIMKLWAFRMRQSWAVLSAFAYSLWPSNVTILSPRDIFWKMRFAVLRTQATVLPWVKNRWDLNHIISAWNFFPFARIAAIEHREGRNKECDQGGRCNPFPLALWSQWKCLFLNKAALHLRRDYVFVVTLQWSWEISTGLVLMRDEWLAILWPPLPFLPCPISR